MTPTTPLVRPHQPAHSVYGGAHRFQPATMRRLGELALAALDRYAPEPGQLAQLFGWPDLPGFAPTVVARVRDKLTSQPVEDYRIDFEDGYGPHSDAEEDEEARRVAEALASAQNAGALPPLIGLRLKPFDDTQRSRSVRTLDLVLDTVLRLPGASLPRPFLITLPKVTTLAQVEDGVRVLEAREARFGLATGSLQLELMVETPQLIIDAGGHCPLPSIADTAGDRLFAAHFGAYDFCAALGIAASEQRLGHPACDVARSTMLIALAGRAVYLSDGATNVLPVPLHSGQTRSPTQEVANRANVHRGWRQHYLDVRHALSMGFYQGWDLHPAQLVSRFAAVFSFFLAGRADASARLTNFFASAARATQSGGAFDDTATAHGLLAFFRRALQSGAVGIEDVTRDTGLTADELAMPSVAAILAARDQR